MLDVVLYHYFSANVDSGAPEDTRDRNEESHSVSDSTDSYQMIEYGLKYGPALLSQSYRLQWPTGEQGGSFWGIERPLSHQFLSEGNMNTINN